jgi:hypothetical protein
MIDALLKGCFSKRRGLDKAIAHVAVSAGNYGGGSL